MVKHKLFRAGFAGLLLAGVSGAAIAADGDLKIELSPRLADAKMADVGVRLTLENPSASAGDVLLEMPVMRVMAPSALMDSSAIQARDSAGPLDLIAQIDEVDPSGFGQGRRWTINRATVGDVVVNYVATPREITPQTRPGPLYDMRAEDAGFHASGGIMLALPPEGWPRKVDLDWDLSGFGENARAASSLGYGNVELTTTQEAINGSFFMAGPLHSQPESGQGPFVGYWLTPPPFDLDAALVKIENAYGQFSDFFGTETQDFKVFMRTTDRFAGGGSGGHNSFIFGTVKGEVREEEELLGLLVHETLHNWLSGLGEATSQWWSEGTTTYYTEVMSRRVGITTVEQFGKGMNALAKSYYLNPRSNLTSAEVTQLFFSDGDAQLVPYQRGPLYFAQLDALIRERSNGARRVEDLVRPLLKARETGGEYSQKGWEDLLRAELGEEGVANFNAMMDGERLDLQPHLLGVCFDREAVNLRRFYTGLRTEFDGRISRVIENTPAASAGLLAGDRLVDPEALKTLEEGGYGEAELLVIRDGVQVTFRFNPWGPEREAYQWVRNSVPDNQCGI